MLEVFLKKKKKEKKKRKRKKRKAWITLQSHRKYTETQ